MHAAPKVTRQGIFLRGVLQIENCFQAEKTAPACVQLLQPVQKYMRGWFCRRSCERDRVDRGGDRRRLLVICVNIKHNMNHNGSAMTALTEVRFHVNAFYYVK